jgi:cysteine dioxygenase
LSAGALRRLVPDLEAALRQEARGGAAVAHLLEAYCAVHDDWREFALFRDGCYARNLVHGSELFELLVLCWHSGQVSPIHDHQGQRCWMGVLEGEVRERHFHRPPGGRGPLVAGRSRVFARGSVAYIHDDIALHDIGPEGEGAVTLHLYSQPIRECRIFDAETGEETLRGLVYHSVEGVPVA